MSALFDPIEPYDAGLLPVSDGHQLYFERSGRRGGAPVLFIHGGPGSGAGAKHRRYYDPRQWDIVLFDQRGCGRSTPFLSLKANTTDHLIADIEALRTHLGFERWVVFGPSWGSTLAIAYAEAHPQRVEALVLEAVFLGTRPECDWFHDRRGAGAIFPDALEALFAGVPDAVSAEPKRFQRWALDQMLAEIEAGAPALAGLGDEALLEALNRSLLYRWSAYEEQIAELHLKPETIPERFAASGPAWVRSHALIEAWYFAHDCFLDADQLIANAGRLTMPVHIIHSRYDVVCPAQSALRLAEACPNATLAPLALSGHLMTPATHALVVETFQDLSARRRAHSPASSP